MKNSSQLFKNSIDKAFSSLPNQNSDTFLAGEKIKSKMKENQELGEKWSEKYKKSINCDNPKGFSQRAHCQGRKKKSETKEAATSGAGVGAYDTPLFGEEKDSEKFKAPVGFKDSKFVRKSFAETPKKIEATEATDSGSVGGYLTPAAWAKSTNKKDWRGASKPLYKGGAFVTVKKKCKKFPYCNQGDIKSLRIYQNESLRDAIKNISKKYNISETTIKAIIQSELESFNNL